MTEAEVVPHWSFLLTNWRTKRDRASWTALTLAFREVKFEGVPGSLVLEWAVNLPGTIGGGPLSCLQDLALDALLRVGTVSLALELRTCALEHGYGRARYRAVRSLLAEAGPSETALGVYDPKLLAALELARIFPRTCGPRERRPEADQALDTDLSARLEEAFGVETRAESYGGPQDSPAETFLQALARWSKLSNEGIFPALRDLHLRAFPGSVVAKPVAPKEPWSNCYLSHCKGLSVCGCGRSARLPGVTS